MKVKIKIFFDIVYFGKDDCLYRITLNIKAIQLQRSNGQSMQHEGFVGFCSGLRGIEGDQIPNKLKNLPNPLQSTRIHLMRG